MTFIDANLPVPVQPTTRWGADPLRMKVGPINRAQAKKFKENIAAFIQEIINQEGLSRSKEPGPVLHIQAEEAKMGPGDYFSANLDIGLNELDPHLFGINSYGE